MDYGSLLPLSMAIPQSKAAEITFRVLSNVEVFGASGIYERVFLQARNDVSPAPPVP